MSEQGEAKRDGASLRRNSGRGMYDKGDAQLSIFNVDYKEYDRSFSLSKATWLKVCSDAVKMKLEPALKLVIGKSEEPKLRLWVIDDTMFQQMLEAWREKYE